MKELNPTTRMYPRTERDAFPHLYKDCIEHYVRPVNNKIVVYILLAFAIMCFLIAKVM